MPLLTTQSAKSYGFTSANLDNVVNSFESIASTRLTSAAPNITFSSIPNTFQHLQLRGIVRGTVSSSQQTAAIRFNGDSGGNYNAHTIISKANAPTTYETGPDTMMEFYEIPGGNQAAGIFGPVIIDILNYKSTDKYKVIRVLYGFSNNSTSVGGTKSATISIFSGVWFNTNAITSISLIEQSGNNSYATGTTFSLYGIKG